MKQRKNSNIINSIDEKLKNDDKKSQYELLIDRGWILPQNDGRFIISEEFNRIMQLFDALFLIWAKEDGAVEYVYPDFYDMSDLNKCGYLGQFHNHCIFACTSSSDISDDIELSSSNYINNPAVCMHCYIQYRNSVISDEHPVVITSKGRCKRNESSGFISLERMMDFTMREIVFIGDKDFVLSKRQVYIEKSKFLLKALGLEGTISLSNDPFFKKEDSIKAVYQRRFKLKYELALKNYDNGHNVAVGSFNYHNYNFSKAYSIKMTNGNLAHTACVAFGLERFAYTYITQIGMDKSFQQLDEYICGLKNEGYK